MKYLVFILLTSCSIFSEDVPQASCKCEFDEFSYDQECCEGGEWYKLKAKDIYERE